MKSDDELAIARPGERAEKLTTVQCRDGNRSQRGVSKRAVAVRNSLGQSIRAPLILYSTIGLIQVLRLFSKAARFVLSSLGRIEG